MKIKPLDEIAPSFKSLQISLNFDIKKYKKLCYDQVFVLLKKR